MSKDKKATSPALLALSAAAAALPGYSGEVQAWAEEQADAGYRYSHYQEASLPASATNGGSGERYQVDSHQFHLLYPYGEAWDFNADLMLETMSGASPWYVAPGSGGQAIQVLSGASIQDRRAVLQGRARQHLEQGRRALSLGISKEDDYLAYSGGAEAEWDFNQRRNTLSVGLGYSYDQLKPTDGGSARFPTRIAKADKDSFTAYAGLSQVLTPQTVAQLGLSYSYSDGYLSDPYKLAYVDANLLPDSRPPDRNQWALTGRLRHYIRSLQAALHVDARYYADNWGVAADSLEVAWVQKLPADWRLTPSLRWYQQGHANFYRPYYNTTREDGFYSSDYRLSAYGALSGRVAAEKSWRGFSFAAAVEAYESDGDLALRSVSDESPGLVDFLVVSAAVSYRWSLAPPAPRSGSALQPEPALPPPVQIVPATP